MIEFLTASENFPFAVALAVMVGIAVLEVLSMMFGTALSGLVDSVLPDVDVDVTAPQASSLSQVLGWLRIGQVPALMLLVVFLTAFGLIGLALQALSNAVVGTTLPGGAASIPALVLALPVVNIVGGVMGRVLLRDETDAVSEDSLVGRIATVLRGRATVGGPAEAKVRDRLGNMHYVLVEPDEDRTVFEAGTSVLLIERNGPIYKAMKNTESSLQDV